MPLPALTNRELSESELQDYVCAVNTEFKSKSIETKNISNMAADLRSLAFELRHSRELPDFLDAALCVNSNGQGLTVFPSLIHSEKILAEVSTSLANHGANYKTQIRANKKVSKGTLCCCLTLPIDIRAATIQETSKFQLERTKNYLNTNIVNISNAENIIHQAKKLIEQSKEPCDLQVTNAAQRLIDSL